MHVPSIIKSDQDGAWALSERNSQCWFSGHASLLPDHPVRCENQLDGRSPDLRVAALPWSFPALPGQWLIPGLLTAYSCGGSNGLGALTAVPHRIPFSSRTRALRTETVGTTIFGSVPGVKGIPPNFARNHAMRGIAVQDPEASFMNPHLQRDVAPLVFAHAQRHGPAKLHIDMGCTDSDSCRATPCMTERMDPSVLSIAPGMVGSDEIWCPTLNAFKDFPVP